MLRRKVGLQFKGPVIDFYDINNICWNGIEFMAWYPYSK